MTIQIKAIQQRFSVVPKAFPALTFESVNKSQRLSYHQLHTGRKVPTNSGCLTLVFIAKSN